MKQKAMACRNMQQDSLSQEWFATTGFSILCYSACSSASFTDMTPAMQQKHASYCRVLQLQ